MSKRAARLVVGVLGAAALGVSSALLLAHQRERGFADATAPQVDHAPHGTPEGWTFSWPPGDPARGREVFARFECYSCHEVKGESFPGATNGDAIGPELSQMGLHHEPEFFAESIINPDAVIDEAYAAPDGTSKMPSFNDSMTVQEVIDLVAYLAALRPPGGQPAPSHDHGGRSSSSGASRHRH